VVSLLLRRGEEVRGRETEYVGKGERSGFVKDCQEIGAMLGSMMNKAHTFSMKQS